MSLNSWREKINISIYGSKNSVLSWAKVASVFVSLTALSALIVYHGYYLEERTQDSLIFIIHLSFGFYVFKYLLGFFYSFHPIDYLKESWFEGILMFLILVDFIGLSLFNFRIVNALGQSLDMSNLPSFYALFIQLYVLIIVVIEFSRASGIFGRLSISPPAILIFSFIALIAIGCSLLMLPTMVTEGNSLSFIDALFTSASAACVTGLTVVDTATFFSAKGHFVIMVLVQLGGLNIISFATIMAMLNRKGIGIKHQSLIQENLSAEGLLGGKGLLRRIFMFSLFMELIGAMAIYMSWSSKMEFVAMPQRFFYSVFHSVSAFNNAGFSLFSKGLYEDMVKDAFLLHIVIAILIFFGSLGFSTMQDLFSLKKMRERFQSPWKTYAISTKIALYTSIGLVLVGAAMFFLLEHNRILNGMNFGESLIASFFQSITTRSAGFNTVDIGALGHSTLLFFLFLMFIGGSSGSTAGGVKTSTFAVIFITAFSTIRGKKNVEAFRHTIPRTMQHKAFTIFLFSISIIFFMSFLLTIVHPEMDLLAIVFEEVSAFCTVGLSMGITEHLNPAAKTILIISMFIGRVGILTLAFALGRTKAGDYKYPETHFNVA